MSNYKTVFFILGVLQIILGLSMIVPIIAQFYYNQVDSGFIGSGLVSIIFGVLFFLSNLDYEKKLTLPQAFLLTALSWLSIAIFGSLPFVFSDLSLSFTNAFFESMSGITTTGSTILTNLNETPKAILLWRAMLQWLGGIGIIVMAITLMPIMNIGGMQLFVISNTHTPEKILPKSKEISIRLIVIYSSLTLVCAFFYKIFGMSFFDSIVHSMTTIATGGFSNYNESFLYFNSFQIEIISIIFMLVGSLPFVLYLQFLHNQKKLIFKDDQIKLFFLILFIIILLTTIWLTTNQSIDAISAFRIALFNITSILTGTGYTSSNFSNWGSFGIVIMMIIMFIGGCAGSTTGGIKIFRLQILFRGAITQIRKLTQPHAVLMMRFNGKSVNENTYNSIMGFFFMYIFLFILSAVSLSLFNLDFLTAFSAAASAISNVGPGLGELIGPSGNYFYLDDGAKWILSITMIIGRLEIFTVLVLLSMNFWRS